MKNTAPVRAVLLDLDGTLLASEEVDLRAMDRLFNEELSLHLSEAQLRDFIGMTSENVLRELAPGREDHLLQRWLAIQDEMRHMVRLFPGVCEALQQLRAAGRALAVVTSQSSHELQATREHIDLEDLIEVWVSCNDAPRPKPAPDPVALALKNLAVDPAQAVMIGDTPFDMAAGRAAGTRIAAALWGALAPRDLLAHEPDYVLRHPREMAQL